MANKDTSQRESMANSDFSSGVRTAMKEMGLTQAQLAAKLGVTQSAISDYVNGRVPHGEKLVAIARALGTTAEALLGLEPLEKGKPLEEVVKLPIGKRTAAEHHRATMSAEDVARERASQRLTAALAARDKALDCFEAAQAELDAATAEYFALNKERVAKLDKSKLSPTMRRALGLE